MKFLYAAAAATLIAGCGDDDRNPVGPVQLDVIGSYTLVHLSFDPQGVLPEVDLIPRIEGALPSLVLVQNGRAQLVFRDPDTGLTTVAEAAYRTTSEQLVQLEFNDRSTLHHKTLLSDRMTFTFTADPRTLTFSGTPPDGIDRRTLLQLVPEFEGEQLFDPVPGQLTVVYRVATN